MKTRDNINAIEWHLQNNVQPILNNAAVTGILRTLDKLNAGELTVNDTITPDTDCTIGEMCEDLRIELIEN